MNKAGRYNSPAYKAGKTKGIKMKSILFGALCIALVLVAGLPAASFDCTKAKSMTEKAICTSPELSKIDVEMAGEFQATKGKLSATAFAEVRGNQIEWLRFASAYCSKTSNGVPKEVTQCLLGVYQSRRDALRETKRIGRFSTYVLVKYAPGEHPGSAGSSVYVQIDDPGTAVQQFNRNLRADTVAQERSSDSRTFKPLTDETVSVVRYEESWGGAHPVSGTTCSLYSFEAHTYLTFSEVFASSRWQSIASGLIKKHFATMKLDERPDLDLTFPSGDKPFSFCVEAGHFSMDGFLSYANRRDDGVDLPWINFEQVLTPLGKRLFLK